MNYFHSILAGVALAIPGGFSDRARGEIVVYKESARETTVGHGFGYTERPRQFLIFDSAAQRPIRAIRFSVSSVTGFKNYTVITNLMDYNVVRGVAGPKGNETLVFRTLASTNQGGRFIVQAYFARGRDATLDLGNGHTAELPRTWKATRQDADNVLGVPYVSQSTSVLQFQREDTRLANANAEIADQTLERLRGRLEAQGFVRAPN